jgi:alkyl sulfatase BDS1-like metallo-beta-lactamase superfamily hydrolase
VLTTDWAVTAREGARFVSPKLWEPVPGVYVAHGYDFSDLAFVATGAGVVAIDTGSNTRHAGLAGLEVPPAE